MKILVIILLMGFLLGQALACDIDGYDIYKLGEPIDVISDNPSDYSYHKCKDDIWSIYTRRDSEIITLQTARLEYTLKIFTLEEDNERIGMIRLQRLGDEKWTPKTGQWEIVLLR